MTTWKPTTCMRCAVGCGLLQNSSDHGQRLETVRADRTHPVNRGLACRRGINETADPVGNRVRQPLLREGEKLVATSWETALEVVCSRLEEARTNSPHGVAILGSGQQTNEAAYALGKLARGGLGTRYYDANTTLCMASAVTAYYQTFGSDGPPPTYNDIPEAKTHLIWGANPAVAHPVMYRWIADSADDDDSRLIVVDPITTETAEDADRHVQLEAGTDLAVARAVLAHLVETDAVAHEFIEQATSGYDELLETLPAVETAAETAGVSRQPLEAVANAFGDKTLVYWGMGINQSVQGTATARALIDLCLATGNLESGSGPFSLTGQANSMGTRVCSSKGTWPGQRSFGDPAHRQTVADAWGVPVSRLPDDPGPGPVGMIDALADGAPEVCWTVATNPLAGMPDGDRVRKTLEKTFVVVQDAFRTETVEIADVVLPAATWGESDGTAINMERNVSRVRAASEPPPNVRQDIDIIAQIGRRLCGELFDQPTLEPAEVFDEFATLTAGTNADLSGISYKRLDAELAVRWPAPDAKTQGGYRYYSEDGWAFPTPSGRARFSTANHGGLAEPTDETYPLTLTTAREAERYNTGVRSRSPEHSQLPTARMHSETVATRLSAFERTRTVVESRRGAVTVAVEADDGVPPGIVWLPIHNAAVNTLTLSTVDPVSAEPNYKQCAVRLSAPNSTELPCESSLKSRSTDS